MNTFRRSLWHLTLTVHGIEYMGAYNDCNPQAFIDEMQAELDRRIEEAKKYQ